jgi:hypothetical protein
VKAASAPPLPDELDALLRRMRWPYMCRAAPEVCPTARPRRWDPAEVLRILIAEEAAGRDLATRRMRRQAASVRIQGTWRDPRRYGSAVTARRRK